MLETFGLEKGGEFSRGQSVSETIMDIRIELISMFWQIKAVQLYELSSFLDIYFDIAISLIKYYSSPMSLSRFISFMSVILFRQGLNINLIYYQINGKNWTTVDKLIKNI